MYTFSCAGVVIERGGRESESESESETYLNM